MSVIDLSLDQQHLIQLIENYVAQFPLPQEGGDQLLSRCYDYMDAFKRVMDSSSKSQMDYICQQYDGFYGFAKVMEMLAQGIADGVIDVLKITSVNHYNCFSLAKENLYRYP